MLFFVAPLISYMVYFAIAFLLLWKVNLRKRLLFSFLLPFLPLVILGMLDGMGVELFVIHHAHGLALPNMLLWLTPGLMVTEPFEIAAARLVPVPQPKPWQLYVRGGMPLPDGSLILYGGVANSPPEYHEEYLDETFKLLARLDPAGNIDPSFKPITVPLKRVNGALTRADGVVLVGSEDEQNHYPMISRLLPDGSLRQLVKVTGYQNLVPEFEMLPQDGVAPVQFLPRWWTVDDKLIRLQPDGSFNDQFNRQAEKVIDGLDLDLFTAAEMDRRGRIIVSVARGLLRFDDHGTLLPPGAVEVRDTQILELALHPDGSIYVTGSKLMRFDENLRPDDAFNDEVSGLAAEYSRFHVLGFSRDGTVIVSLVNKETGTRIFTLNSQGRVVREVQKSYLRAN